MIDKMIMHNKKLKTENMASLRARSQDLVVFLEEMKGDGVNSDFLYMAWLSEKINMNIIVLRTCGGYPDEPVRTKNYK